MLDVAVVWLHRDLRLHDNPALAAALLTARRVVVTYVWAPQEEGQFQPGRCSRWWLYQSLRKLDAQLASRGSRICYRRGPCAVDQLLDVCKESGARVVFFNNVYDPLSLVRDHEVKQRLQSAGILSRSFNAELLYEPWEVVDASGKPFTTFASFWDKLVHGMPKPLPEPMVTEPEVIPTPSSPSIFRLTLDDLALESAEELACNAHFASKWTPGTTGALQLLVKFLEEGLQEFDHDRAKVDRNSTSQLSPHIHFGEISVRVIFHEVRAREAALRASRPDSTAVPDFLQQLGYREYSRYLSFHFPFTHERSLLEHVRAVPAVHCPMRFKAWRQGMTGYPIIDAAMRELWATGWMHNRARVFTASFLVKNLLLPWQWGLKHFWDMLLDADLECDALGWQYVAGCLRDAHPFNYMLDVESESKRFDPHGNFIRQWIPALSRVPLEYIHCPWRAPRDVLQRADVTLGEEYPLPIITVEESRAAVDRAWGVIQRCRARMANGAEPYAAPTVPVEMKLLEPEEEVEQAAPGTRMFATASRTQATAGVLPAILRTSGEGRAAAYAPDVVLPDITDIIGAAHGGSPAAAVESCGACCDSSGRVVSAGASEARLQAIVQSPAGGDAACCAQPATSTATPLRSTDTRLQYSSGAVSSAPAAAIAGGTVSRPGIGDKATSSEPFTASDTVGGRLSQPVASSGHASYSGDAHVEAACRSANLGSGAPWVRLQAPDEDGRQAWQMPPAALEPLPCMWPRQRDAADENELPRGKLARLQADHDEAVRRAR